MRGIRAGAGNVHRELVRPFVLDHYFPPLTLFLLRRSHSAQVIQRRPPSALPRRKRPSTAQCTNAGRSYGYHITSSFPSSLPFVNLSAGCNDGHVIMHIAGGSHISCWITTPVPFAFNSRFPAGCLSSHNAWTGRSRSHERTSLILLGKGYVG